MNEVWHARSGIVARGRAGGRVRSRRRGRGRGGVAAAGSAARPALAAGRIYPLACLIAIGRALYLPGPCAADEEHRELACGHLAGNILVRPLHFRFTSGLPSVPVCRRAPGWAICTGTLPGEAVLRGRSPRAHGVDKVGHGQQL